MKLVIYTQFTENYGDTEKPYWKMKGGDTYVVENLTQAQIAKIQEHGVPTLKALIETAHPYSTEYIIGVNVVPDSASICEAWESPTKLSWVNGRWTAMKVIENDSEYGYMRNEIQRQISSWDMMMGGERENFNSVYVLRDGRIVKESDLAELV